MGTYVCWRYDVIAVITAKFSGAICGIFTRTMPHNEVRVKAKRGIQHNLWR